jgi:hypothetical protein
METIDHGKYPLVNAETSKYLYHLSYKSHRQSILKDTLRGKRKALPFSNRPMVFAHNTEEVSSNWYWMCLDIYEKQFCEDDEEHYIYRDKLRYFVNKHYDIWRIDNDIAKKTWYIDQIGFEDCFADIKQDYYVKCFGEIKKEALTLCALDDEVVESIKITNGSLQKTYYNQIIAREDYITKHGFTPETENLIKKKTTRLLELINYNEKRYANQWKKLKNKNISILNIV